jgi:4-diphosphocytidyl-2-C-methyl-D-erythritol kinase
VLSKILVHRTGNLQPKNLFREAYSLLKRQCLIVAIYKIKAPAKLNIRLKVTGQRPDGYHELISIMVPIDLFDLLEFTVIPKGIELACDGFQVPANGSNLAYRAARSFLSRTGLQKGISMRLTKNIPVAAGMGGGSSDAAATLLFLNELWSSPLSLPDLQELAVHLGADVPFFLHCRPCLAMGIGEILEPLERWPKSWYLIVTPPLKISTSWVYGNLKLKLTAGEYSYINNRLKKEIFDISQILENDLEEVTSASFPVIETIKKALLHAGAEGAMMTGSGPSVFGVFSFYNQALSAKQYILSQNLGDVFVATDWKRT